MSTTDSPRRCGRPPRTTEAFKIRATVPDDHPLLPKLKELGPWMGARYLLDLAAGRLEAGQASAAPTPRIDGPIVSAAGAVPAGHPTVSEAPKALAMTDDLAALFSFSGGMNG